MAEEGNAKQLSITASLHPRAGFFDHDLIAVGAVENAIAGFERHPRSVATALGDPLPAEDNEEALVVELDGCPGCLGHCNAPVGECGHRARTSWRKRIKS